ncbi:TIMD4 protein, partial [Oreotrochilus melanogaster]|nr:TIMD4 protein [Oreotrochilus melanogaster]
HAASETVVRGVIGQPVQLPCFYQVARNKDISDMCWGRGPCPNSKCKDKILHTTGNRVTFRVSQRYNLRGYISYGDVSLRIEKVTAEDAGTYCCRVEIPGWFNDIKQNIQLVVARAPPVTTTTTRKAPVSPKQFRKTTFAPQATTGYEATSETGIFLTTTTPPATSATTTSPAVMTLETIAPPAFAVTTNKAFTDTMVLTSVPPDFSSDFQAADMRTEDDSMFSSDVTTEFPSTFPTAEGTRGADTFLVVEDLPAAREKDISEVSATHSCMNRFKVNMLLKLFQLFAFPFQFPTYAILIVCPIVVSILFILLFSFWKRKHTKKFVIKSLGPAEGLTKIFSGAEGENTIFSL